jgi:hypothetical protein
MSKIIIDNRSSHSDVAVLGLVQRVVRRGRNSNNGTQYCYLTRCLDAKALIATDLNKKSDRFIVMDDNEPLNVDEE